MNTISNQEINSILYPNRSDKEFYVKQIVVKTTGVALGVFASSFMGWSVPLVATGGLFLSFILAGRFNKEIHQDLAVLAIGVSLAVLTLFSANCAIRSITGIAYEIFSCLGITTVPELIHRLFILSVRIGFALPCIDRSADIAYKLLTDKIARNQLAADLSPFTKAPFTKSPFEVAFGRSIGLFFSLFVPLSLFRPISGEYKYYFDEVTNIRRIAQQLSNQENFQKVQSWLNEQMEALRQLVQNQPLSEDATKTFIEKRTEILNHIQQLNLVRKFSDTIVEIVNKTKLEISVLTSPIVTLLENNEEKTLLDLYPLRADDWQEIAAELGVPYNNELGISLFLMGLQTVEDLKKYQIITGEGRESKEKIVQKLKEFIRAYKKNSRETVSKNAVYNLLRGGVEANCTPFERRTQKILAIAFRIFQCGLLVTPLIIAPKTTLAGAVSMIILKNLPDRAMRVVARIGAAFQNFSLLNLIYSLVVERNFLSDTPFASFSRENFKASSLLGKLRIMSFELGVTSLSSSGLIGPLIFFSMMKRSGLLVPGLFFGYRYLRMGYPTSGLEVFRPLGFFVQGMALGNECVALASEGYRRLQQSFSSNRVVPA